jgi:hypothetical protein
MCVEGRGEGEIALEPFTFRSWKKVWLWSLEKHAALATVSLENIKEQVVVMNEQHCIRYIDCDSTHTSTATSLIFRIT